MIEVICLHCFKIANDDISCCTEGRIESDKTLFCSMIYIKLRIHIQMSIAMILIFKIIF